LLVAPAVADDGNSIASNQVRGRYVGYNYDEEPAKEPIPEAAPASNGCCQSSSCGQSACGESACGEETACGVETACGGGCDWCCLGDPIKLHDMLCGECDDSGIDIGGWTQWGYHNEKNGLFNNHDNRVHNHQSWLYAEKVADGSCGFDWGFRGDIMYGVDAADTQAFSNPPGTWDFMNGWDHGSYGFALPQLYGEVAIGDLSIKAGHFFTLVGYEVVPATGNFFYSHAFTMYNSEPFTHTGGYATYKASDAVTVYGGWTAGWDTGFERFNDGDRSDGSSFLGGAAVTVVEGATVTYIMTAGDLGVRGEGYSHSIVADLTITDKINYVAQSDLVETNSGGDHQVGLNQYLFYTVNDCLKAGVRGEWWKTSGVSFYEVTGGVNYKPHANLIVRPEVRYQWSRNTAFANAAGIPINDAIFGVDAIVTF
jgi:hypothetical protein